MKIGNENVPKLFREENIALLGLAIIDDEFQDLPQIETKGDISHEEVDFILRNIKSSPLLDHTLLEIGCGSGRLLGKIPHTHLLEPSSHMLDRLRHSVTTLNQESTIEIRQGVAEYIPYDMQFDNIVFMNGFFQVRSDYEALIEVNTHLKVGGMFMFNILSDDTENIVCGRVLGLKNYVRVVEEFGFSLVERRQDGYLAFEKVEDFRPQLLRKLQLVYAGNGLHKVLNLDLDRDRALL